MLPVKSIWTALKAVEPRTSVSGAVSRAGGNGEAEYTEQRNNGLGGLEELGGGDLGAVDGHGGEGALGGIEERHDGCDGVGRERCVETWVQRGEWLTLFMGTGKVVNPALASAGVGDAGATTGGGADRVSWEIELQELKSLGAWVLDMELRWRQGFKWGVGGDAIDGTKSCSESVN